MRGRCSPNRMTMDVPWRHLTRLDFFAPAAGHHARNPHLLPAHSDQFRHAFLHNSDTDESPMGQTGGPKLHCAYLLMRYQIWIKLPLTSPLPFDAKSGRRHHHARARLRRVLPSYRDTADAHDRHDGARTHARTPRLKESGLSMRRLQRFTPMVLSLDVNAAVPCRYMRHKAIPQYSCLLQKNVAWVRRCSKGLTNISNISRPAVLANQHSTDRAPSLFLSLLRIVYTHTQ